METEKPILIKIFGDSPFIKIVDTLMDHPNLTYTKKELAEVNEISRSTLYRIWPRIKRLNIVERVKKVGNIKLYKLNFDSKVVKGLYKLEKEVRGEKIPIKA